jgi:hypothetical protein
MEEELQSESVSEDQRGFSQSKKHCCHKSSRRDLISKRRAVSTPSQVEGAKYNFKLRIITYKDKKRLKLVH